MRQVGLTPLWRKISPESEPNSPLVARHPWVSVGFHGRRDSPPRPPPPGRQPPPAGAPATPPERPSGVSPVIPTGRAQNAGRVAGVYTTVLPPFERFSSGFPSAPRPPESPGVSCPLRWVLHSHGSPGAHCLRGLSLPCPAARRLAPRARPMALQTRAPRSPQLGPRLSRTGPSELPTAQRAAPPARPLLPQTLPGRATVPPRSRAASALSIVPRSAGHPAAGAVGSASGREARERALHVPASAAPYKLNAAGAVRGPASPLRPAERRARSARNHFRANCVSQALGGMSVCYKCSACFIFLENRGEKNAAIH